MEQPKVSDQSDLPMGINSVRVVLQRGDGECLVVGKPPDFNNLVSMLSFLVWLSGDLKRVGDYQMHTQRWLPRELDFSATTKNQKDIKMSEFLTSAEIKEKRAARLHKLNQLTAQLIEYYNALPTDEDRTYGQVSADTGIGIHDILDAQRLLDIERVDGRWKASLRTD